MNNTERLDIDHANLSPATAQLLGDGRMPPPPIPQGLALVPPSQPAPSVVGTLPDRLRIFADSDKADWHEYVPDVPNPDGAGGNLINYWPDHPPQANYVLTLRSYWALVPDSYTLVTPGRGFQKEYSTTFGIPTTDAQNICAELGVDVRGLSAKLSAEFGREVTTLSPQTQTTPYTVDAPTDGFIRVWMLWQLVDELVALDPDTGDVVANPTRHGDVNWSLHNPTGAFLHYTNLDQHFPEPVIIQVQKDFPGHVVGGR